MISDVADWVLINVLTNFQVSTSLIALIILIVASFLFSRKPTEKSTFGHGLGASLFVFSLFVFLLANIADLADVFTAWATIVLAGIAALSFEESRRLRKQYKEREERDRKERLLNEIIQWAEDINNASLVPDISPSIKQREINVLMRYGSSFSKAISIETIASESFKKELLGNVQEVINTLLRFMCINQLKVLGAMPTKKGFPETVIKEIEKEIAEGKKSIDELWYEYAKKLTDSVLNLLIGANKIKARDIG